MSCRPGSPLPAATNSDTPRSRGARAVGLWAGPVVALPQRVAPDAWAVGDAQHDRHHELAGLDVDGARKGPRRHEDARIACRIAHRAEAAHRFAGDSPPPRGAERFVHPRQELLQMERLPCRRGTRVAVAATEPVRVIAARTTVHGDEDHRLGADDVLHDAGRDPGGSGACPVQEVQDRVAPLALLVVAHRQDDARADQPVGSRLRADGGRSERVDGGPGVDLLFGHQRQPGHRRRSTRGAIARRGSGHAANAACQRARHKEGEDRRPRAQPRTRR